MTRRVVVLPNGRRCGLGVYVASWAKVAAVVATDPKARIKGWDHFPEDADRVLRALREGLHDRINRHLRHFGKGRKWASDWQNEMWRASRDLNQPRLRIYWLPSDLRGRFGHRLATRGED